MAKTLRTSGDYNIVAGAGASSIVLDSSELRVTGNLIVTGTQTTISSTNSVVTDNTIILNNNEAGAGISLGSAGIELDRGSLDNATLLFNETADVFEFKIGSALAKLRGADPIGSTDVATKGWVESTISAGSMSNFAVVGDDAVSLVINDGNNLSILGGQNISTSGVAGTDTLTIDLDSTLTQVNSISAATSNALSLNVDSNYHVVVNNILGFASALVSDPLGTNPVTRLYAKTPGGGGTGLYFKNDNVNSGSADELISKKKATALAIALG
jgi:hypothetical protein